MKRLIIPAVTAVCVFLSACATGTGVIDDFFTTLIGPSADQGAENTGAPVEKTPPKARNSGKTTGPAVPDRLPVLASVSARQTRTYPRPASYEAAYAYRNDTADPQVRRLPQQIESLRSKDPAEYVRQAAAYISKNSKDPFDKVKKAHDLVALTIRYDAASFLANRNPPQDYESVLKSKLAVCEGYSNVFKKFCDELGVDAEVVHGYGRGVGSSPFIDENPADSNHAWNIVFIENAGYLIDCTWDAGNLRGSSFQADYTTDYLFLKPEYFIYNHFPEDPRQQLLEKPLSPVAFSRLPFCRPKYFEIFSAEAGDFAKVLRAAGKTELEFSLKDGFTPSVEVYDETGNKKLEHRSFVQKEGDLYRAYLSFPAAENYMVRFFIKKESARAAESCAEFGVISTAASGVRYPTQYTSFGPGISIISPLEMPLVKNQTYEFKIRAEGKEIIALLYNRNIIPLEKDEAGNFFIEAEIPSNTKEIMIGAANNPRGRYEGLVTYEVK
ncbi:hypothetical protein LQZ21_07870 [Treponema sp. TIM-1]|uniref:transglutaminase domain-containing protein n=1 Tax=Treponema sp. TIM-1 TaxID=2898417 RepID=UPI00397F5ED8